MLYMKGIVMNLDEKLDFWIKTNRNVLLIGKKGCGKTTRAINSLTRNNIKYKYFSSPTLDPWVDFVGIPKENLTSENRIIEFIKPGWHNDDVECIIIDEYNRGQNKIRSACMELIQFKSINGVEFPNLKMVWAMINETDDEEDYNVEALDPAEKDRFHVHYKVKYEPDRLYFETLYKENGIKAINWWNEQTRTIKNLVSPRRLDYALSFFLSGGDIEDVLPMECNPLKLQTILSMDDIYKILDNLRLKPVSEIKNWFSHPNNLDISLKTIISNNVYTKEFLYLLPTETISKLIANDTYIQNTVVSDYLDNDVATQILDTIVESNANKNLCKQISKRINDKRLSKSPLQFSGTVKYFEFQNKDRSVFNEWKESIERHRTSGHYSSRLKISDMENLLLYLVDDSTMITEAADEIEKIASNTVDTVFKETDVWIKLFNTRLTLLKDSEKKKGTQYFLRKNYPYIFAKTLRLRLESSLLEVKQ